MLLKSCSKLFICKIPHCRNRCTTLACSVVYNVQCFFSASKQMECSQQEVCTILWFFCNTVSFSYTSRKSSNNFCTFNSSFNERPLTGIKGKIKVHMYSTHHYSASLSYMPQMNVTEWVIVNATVVTTGKYYGMGLFVFILTTLLTPACMKQNTGHSWVDWPVLMVLIGPDRCSWHGYTVELFCCCGGSSHMCSMLVTDTGCGGGHSLSITTISGTHGRVGDTVISHRCTAVAL